MAASVVDTSRSFFVWTKVLISDVCYIEIHVASLMSQVII